MDERFREVIRVEFSQSFISSLIITGLATLGVGTAALLSKTLTWPRQLNDRGILLRSGKRIRWSSITHATRIKVFAEDHQIMDEYLELYVGRERISIDAKNLYPADKILEFVKKKLKENNVKIR